MTHLVFDRNGRYRVAVDLPVRTALGEWVYSPDQYRGERVYSAFLALQVDGLVEVDLNPFGRADVATERDVWEVEPLSSWKHGMRQVAAYVRGSGCRGNLALIGDAFPPLQNIIFHECQNAGFRLWWWNSVAHRFDEMERQTDDE